MIEPVSAWIRDLTKLNLNEDLHQIWASISDQDIQTISNFGRVFSQHEELFEKYWHLTRDAEKYKNFRPSDTYSYHDEKNNIINSGLSLPVLHSLESIQQKLITALSDVALSMYPAFVPSLLTSDRNRLPIHTHKKPGHVANKTQAPLSLSFALRMSPSILEDDGTRLRFFRPSQEDPQRLHEECFQKPTDQIWEFKPQNISVYLFDTETAPHTAIFGKALYCWLIFDHLQFHHDFDYKPYSKANKVLSLDLA